MKDFCQGCGSCCELLMPYCENYDKDNRICKDYDNRPWMCIQRNFLGKEFATETCSLLKHLRLWKDESNNKARCYRVAKILAMSLWGTTKKQIIGIEKKINSDPKEFEKMQEDFKKYEYAFIKEDEMMLLNNCLVKALSETLNKSREEIARIFVDGGIGQIKGQSIPLKKAVEIAKTNGLSLDKIGVSRNPDGVYHAIPNFKEEFVFLSSLDMKDTDYIGEPMSLGMGMLYGGIASGAGGILGGLFGGDDYEQPELQVKNLPGYEESDQARKEIQARLQEWGALPGYGAISPDWGDIWERAKGKVSRYYWGGPGGTGLAGKVKAGAARRGVSESPAMDTLMTRMGQQEGIQLGEMGTEQALQEALFGERGRQSWFGQMQNLASMRPSYATSAGVSQPQGQSTGQMLGDLGSAAGGAIQQHSQNQWMQNYLKEMLGKGNLGVADPVGGFSEYPGGYSGMSGLN